MKFVASGFKGMAFEILKAKGLGEFCSARLKLINGDMLHQIFGNNFMESEYFLIWLVETENSFLVEQYYMYVGAKIGPDSLQHISSKILENRS